MTTAQTKTISGFTLVEVLVVIGLMLFIAIPSVYAVLQVRANHSLVAAAEEVESALKTAKRYAREGKSEADWVFRVTSGKDYSLWSRQDTNPPVQDLQFRLNDQVNFDGVAAYPYEVWFEKGTGNTTNHVVSLRASNDKLSRVIISPAGFIEIQ